MVEASEMSKIVMNFSSANFNLKCSLGNNAIIIILYFFRHGNIT